MAHKAYQEIDSEGKGYITNDDIRYFLKTFYIRVTEDEAESIIREFDASDDGTLNVEEF